MRLVLVTGLSGAGKSQALRYMEDMGFFCVDNLPPSMLPQFVKLCNTRGDIQQVAVGMDVRGGKFFDDIPRALMEMKQYNYEVLFMEAPEDVLIKRYKETRRLHPLNNSGVADSLQEAIEEEKRLMEPLRESAPYIIDTAALLPRQLKERLWSLFGDGDVQRKFRVILQSFGYKYGIPSDADLVFDVRFIPNPFYIDRLRTHTGKDADVRDFVMAYDETKTFLQKTSELLQYLIPMYIREGKNELVVSVGCTGGMHRSVVMADELQDMLSTMGYSAESHHRDMDTERKRTP